MKFRHDMLRMLPVVLMGMFLAWCGYYLVFGTNSIFALKTMKIQQAQMQTRLDQVRDERVAVESKVKRLRPDSLDWDLVEEQAAMTLGDMPKDAAAVKM